MYWITRTMTWHWKANYNVQVSRTYAVLARVLFKFVLYDPVVL